MPAVAPVKICHGGEIHRFTWDIEANGFTALHARFSETFPHLANNAFTIQYTDPHGDVVTVANDAEYRAAYELFRTPGGELGLVRFTATTRAATAAFHEQVADPILKAIEKLVATLNAAMEKVKHEDWKARAQSGVDQTHDAFQTAASDARASLRAAHASLRDLPFDQLLKDTADGLKVAADGISVFAHELVTELQHEQRVQVATDRFKAAAESVAAFAKDAVDELKLSAAGAAMMASVPTPMAAMATADVMPVAPVAEVAPPQQEEVVVADVVDAPAPVTNSNTDSDWEQVAEPLAVAEAAVVASPAMEMPVVVVAETPAAVEVSADERQWATELALIRSILSDVDTHAAIEQLVQANGNVEVVLNALMEAM